MAAKAQNLIPPGLFRKINAAYRATWKASLFAVNAEGVIVQGHSCCRACPGCATIYRRAFEETLRWGEPFITVCSAERVLWGVPLMQNQWIMGGLLAGGTNLDRQDLTLAAQALMALAVGHNLTNEAALTAHRETYYEERRRAEALHMIKDRQYQSMREIYLSEEPILISAIRQGDIDQALEIVCRMFLAAYRASGHRLDLARSLALEIAVMISRSAVESGANPQELLGMEYNALADVSHAVDEAHVLHWLEKVVERSIRALQDDPEPPTTVIIANIIRFMEEHLSENLSRDSVASHAHMSPSNFSRSIRNVSGMTFSDLLTRMRINRAKELLVLTDESLMRIAAACGFRDQSYFTKSFRKQTGKTPGNYRAASRAAKPS